MTGEDAAIRMQRERGYVVIAFPPATENEAPIPSVHTEFASAPLLSHELIIKTTTNRKDWEQQVEAIFGKGHPACKKNPPLFGQRFFRCELQKLRIAARRELV